MGDVRSALPVVRLGCQDSDFLVCVVLVPSPQDRSPFEEVLLLTGLLAGWDRAGATWGGTSARWGCWMGQIPWGNMVGGECCFPRVSDSLGWGQGREGNCAHRFFCSWSGLLKVPPPPPACLLGLVINPLLLYPGAFQTARNMLHLGVMVGT